MALRWDQVESVVMVSMVPVSMVPVSMVPVSIARSCEIAPT
jgi:hypothetical protein